MLLSMRKFSFLCQRFGLLLTAGKLESSVLSLSDNSLTIPISVVQSSVRSFSFKSSFLTNKEATPQTIFSRISKSFTVLYSHVAARILRSATKDLNGSHCFCVLASHLNLCLPYQRFHEGRRFQRISSSIWRCSNETQPVHLSELLVNGRRVDQ